MEETTVHAVQFVSLLLLCFIVVFTVAASRLNIPYPIALVLAGLGLAFVPGIPRVPLDPDLVFLVVLPPLLYSAAWLTSWREFSYNLSSILLLAFGLVGFTVFGVAAVGPKLLPGFDWRTAFLLGAVASTTDAIAATSIGHRVGLPRRVMDVLEGESLVNDASGLLALEFGLALAVRGEMPALGFAIWRLVYLVVAGIGVGLLAGVIVNRVEPHVDDAPVEIGISILVPYACYLTAEAIHASGVLAVVAAGLYLSRKSTALFSPDVRIQAYAVWNALTFMLNGFVFVMIGLQLPYVLADIGSLRLRGAVIDGFVFSLLLIALRLLWVFPGAYFAYLIRRRFQHQNEPVPPAKEVFIVGWTGMRGVVALAAAISLPSAIEGGSTFPQRSLIIFLTFSVIFVTLVLQGLTLPVLIRKLGLAAGGEHHQEEQEARKTILRSALDRLAELKSADSPEFSPVYDDIARHYRDRIAAVAARDEDPNGAAPAQVERFRRASIELRKAERETVIRLRNERRISDDLLRRIERELDLIDSRFN